MIINHTNIILIGMPGCGKSTVGVMLAKQLSCGFIDTDLLIQTTQGRTLQNIVDTDGYMALRAIEETILLGIHRRNHVIATGGSAAYSQPAMMHLKSNGVAVFLDVDIRTLERRVQDYATRGLAKRADQTLEDLFHERSALYTRHADITIRCAALTHEQVVGAIVAELQKTRQFQMGST